MESCCQDVCVCLFLLSGSLKLIVGDGNLCFKWGPCILGTTAQMPGAEADPTARLSVTVNSKQYTQYYCGTIG